MTTDTPSCAASFDLTGGRSAASAGSAACGASAGRHRMASGTGLAATASVALLALSFCGFLVASIVDYWPLMGIAVGLIPRPGLGR